MVGGTGMNTYDVAKHLGFSEPYYGQLSLQVHGKSHVINFSDVENVVSYLYDRHGNVYV